MSKDTLSTALIGGVVGGLVAYVLGLPIVIAGLIYLFMRAHLYRLQAHQGDN